MHLQRKTAWSNQSLVGCRISCLVDYKEWHEGYVTQLHKSGKHYVEFRMVNEKRWLYMKKISFYIVERPPHKQSLASPTDSSEFKETNSPRESDGLAPIEDKDTWVYCEDISIDYAFAQSILFKIYGNSIQETGHLTKGHICLTENDRKNAIAVKGSLLYGELLPRGVNKALGSARMAANNAAVLFDLGMGTGKVLIQAFLQFKNLRYVYGIELSAGRYKIAEEALLKMVHLLGSENYQIQVSPGKFIIVRESVSNSCDGNDQEMECSERVLHFECGNMFSISNIEVADIIMMETDFPSDLYPDLHKLLSGMQEGARILTYLDLRRISKGISTSDDHEISFSNMFKQLESNKHLSDRYPTSWSVQRGHHFFLWNRINHVCDHCQSQSFGSASSSWGHGFTVGIFSHPGGHSTSPSIDSQCSSTALTPKANKKDAKPAAGGSGEQNGSNRCLPFGLGNLLPSFLRGKSKNDGGNGNTNNTNNSTNGNVGKGTNGVSVAPSPAVRANVNLGSSSSSSSSSVNNKERTVIPINICPNGSSSPTVIKIPTGGLKANYCYPNYIERAANVREHFVSSDSCGDRDADESSERGDESDLDSQTTGHRSSVRGSARGRDRDRDKDLTETESPRISPRSTHSNKNSTRNTQGYRSSASPKKHYSSSSAASSGRSSSRSPRSAASSRGGVSAKMYRGEGDYPRRESAHGRKEEGNSEEANMRLSFHEDSDDVQSDKFTPMRGSPSSIDEEGDTAQRYYMTGTNPFVSSMSPSPMGPPGTAVSQPIYAPSLSRDGTPTQLIMASYTDQHMHSPISMEAYPHFPALHHNHHGDQDIATLPFSTIGLNYTTSVISHGKVHSSSSLLESPKLSPARPDFLLSGGSDSPISEADG